MLDADFPDDLGALVRGGANRQQRGIDTGTKQSRDPTKRAPNAPRATPGYDLTAPPAKAALAGPVDIDALPSGLRELVRALGEPTAFRLVERAGGGRLIVPKRPHPEHYLFQELGARGFVDLVSTFGGEVIDLPKYDSVLRQLRHRRVRQLRHEGHTMDRVAVLTGYTRRQVINILAADSDLAVNSQLDLFGLPSIVADQADELPNLPPNSANDPFGLGRQRG